MGPLSPCVHYVIKNKFMQNSHLGIWNTFYVYQTFVIERYSDYPSALDALNLDSLATRRQTLSLKFAKFNQTKDMFSLNNNDAIDVRHTDKFQVQFAKGSRLLDSAIPQLQRALNDDAKS